MYSLNCCSWAPANSTDHLHFTLYLSPSSPSAHSVLHSVIAIYFVSFYRNDCINSCFLIDCQHIWEAKSSAYPSQSHINHRVVFFLNSATSLWWIVAYGKEAAKANGLWGWNLSFLSWSFSSPTLIDTNAAGSQPLSTQTGSSALSTVFLHLSCHQNKHLAHYYLSISSFLQNPHPNLVFLMLSPP